MLETVYVCQTLKPILTQNKAVFANLLNTFPILVRRWQVFTGPIEMHPSSVAKILKAAIVFDDPAAIRYMRDERFTYPTTESLQNFYASGLKLDATE